MLADPQRRSPTFVALRLGCALAIALVAAASLLYQARDASAGELLSDAASGRVTRVLVTDDDVLWWTGGVRPWQTGLPLQVVDGSYDRAHVPRTLAQYAREGGFRVVERPHRLPQPLRVLGAVAALMTLLLLVAGPVPDRVTRWGWFWLCGTGRTAGVGALLFLLLSGPTPGLPTAPDEHERWDAWKGFWVSVVVGIALQVLWFGVRQVGWPDSDGVYDVVRPAASPLAE